MSQQNRDNTDDILDILKKKKESDIQSGSTSLQEPTRVDNAVVGQSSRFDDQNTQKNVETQASAKDNGYSQPKDSVTVTSDNQALHSAPIASNNQSSAMPKSEIPQKPLSIPKVVVPQTPAAAVPQNAVQDSAKTTVSVPRQAVQRQGSGQRPIQRSATGAQSAISLSDFDNMSKTNPKTGKKNNGKKRRFVMPGYAKVIIYLAFILTISGFLSAFIIDTANDIFAFKKQDKEVAVTLNKVTTFQDAVNNYEKSKKAKPSVVNGLKKVAIIADKKATIKKTGDMLEKKGLIGNSCFFELYYDMKYADNPYYTGEIIEGQHILNNNFSFDKIFSETLASTYSTEVVRVTIPEGKTIYEIIDLFMENRIINEDNKEDFIAKLNSLAFEYDFLPQIEDGQETDKIYMLEGYLFPDTYDFYVGENLDSIISKLLNNFDKKFEDAYYERARELGMTVDEVVTLASMIQAEGDNDEDYYKISSVFHNRLRNWKSQGRDYLGSDATTLYSFQGTKEVLDVGDNQNTIHPYNTYLNRGLPPGAICNPGTEAIHAALYPDDTDYYYFYTATTNGVTYFAITEAEHNRNIEKDKNGTIGN